MKKILVILMTLVMLLSTCAFAEAVEADGAEVVIGDIVVLAGETPILDLTGLSLGLGVYNGENTGMQLTLGAAGNEVLALNLGIAAEQVLLSMTGVSGVYSLDLNGAAESMGIDANLTLNVNEAAEAIKPEDQLALMALVTEGMALVQAGTAAVGTEEIDGVAYEVTIVEISAEQLQPLLEKAVAILDNYSYLLADSGVESFTQLYQALAPALAVSGTIYDSENAGVINFDLGGSLYSGTEEAVNGYLNVYIDGEAVNDHEVDAYVELTASTDAQSYTLGFDIVVIDENDGAWVPASDAPVDLLTAIQDEAQSQQLMLQAMSSGMMALSQMAAANETVAALMGSLMAG